MRDKIIERNEIFYKLQETPIKENITYLMKLILDLQDSKEYLEKKIDNICEDLSDITDKLLILSNRKVK